jgi:hypothetical protein
MEITKDMYDNLYNLVNKIEKCLNLINRLNAIQHHLSNKRIYYPDIELPDGFDIDYPLIEKYTNEDQIVHNEIAITHKDLRTLNTKKSQLYNDLFSILLNIYKDYCTKNPQFSTIKIRASCSLFNSKESTESITLHQDIMDNLKLSRNVYDDVSIPYTSGPVAIIPRCYIKNEKFSQIVRITINPDNIIFEKQL